MEEATIALQVPAAMVERAEEYASRRECTAETVMLDWLSLKFGGITDLDLEPEALQALGDEQLWAVVYRRLTPKQEARLHELLDLGNQGKLLGQDEDELEVLAALVDRLTLLRSKALALLHKRGHDLDHYFNFAA